MNLIHSQTTSQYMHTLERTHARGSIILAVSVVTLMGALVAASLLFRMQAQTTAVGSLGQGDQAHAAAMSGIHLSIALLITPPADETSEPTVESELEIEDPALAETAQAIRPKTVAPRSMWYDIEELFKNRLVYDDGANRWYFTVYARNWLDKESVRYGLTDEAGKININNASEEVLINLPGMTTELVDTLIDYRDRDSETRPEGAEQDYYDQLPTPYMAKNSPLGTLEELLMVKSYNAGILYGEDANRNGLLEPNEDDSDEKFPPDDNDGLLNSGLHEVATVTATDIPVSSTGEAQVNINGNAQQLQGQLAATGLSNETISFIVAYRGDNQRFTHPSQLLGMTYTTQNRGGGRGGGRGGRGGQDSDGGQMISSGVTAEDLPIVLDKLTVNNPNRPVSGLINVNSAPSIVLAALPEIDQSVAESIVEARGTLEDEELKTTAWLLTQNIVDEDTYKNIAPKLTSRGFQYHIRVIGFGIPSGRFRILEAIIDIGGTTPRITYLRDITKLGVPFPLVIDDAQGGSS